MVRIGPGTGRDPPRWSEGPRTPDPLMLTWGSEPSSRLVLLRRSIRRPPTCTSKWPIRGRPARVEAGTPSGRTRVPQHRKMHLVANVLAWVRLTRRTSDQTSRQPSTSQRAVAPLVIHRTHMPMWGPQPASGGLGTVLAQEMVHSSPSRAAEVGWAQAAVSQSPFARRKRCLRHRRASALTCREWCADLPMSGYSAGRRYRSRTWDLVYGPSPSASRCGSSNVIHQVRSGPFRVWTTTKGSPEGDDVTRPVGSAGHGPGPNSGSRIT